MDYGGPQFKTNDVRPKNVEPLVNKDNDVLFTELVNSSVSVKDNFETEDTLSEILLELKKVNFHLSLITDTCITETEVD